MKNSNTAIEPVDAAVCVSFADACDALSRRRAGEIAEQAIDRFVALRWLDWSGGTLRVTQLGEIVRMKVQSHLMLEAA